MQSERISFGAKVLKENEVKHIFPQMNKLMDEIKRIQTSCQKNDCNDLDEMENNNTFSILGGRGSGKSSILLTIRNKLVQAHGQNIVFPMIELDRISNNFDVFGCILSSVKNRMDSYIEDVKKTNIHSRIESCEEEWDDRFKECYLKRTSELKQAFDKVMEFYLYTHDEYRKLLTQNYTDFNSYRQNSALMLSANTALKKHFNRFIKSWSDYIRKYGEKTSEGNPLFCFFFDDIDLCPSKILELINVILQFMMHPNVICFLSGDEKLMKEVLANPYKEYDNASVLAENVLAKMLPYPYRYHIRTWSNELKPDFISIDSSKNLGQLTQAFLEKCTVSHDCEELLCYTGESKEEFIPQAFSMFSEQTRKLNYVFYSIDKVLSDNENNDEIDKEDRYTVLRTIYKGCNAFHGENGVSLEDNLFNVYLDYAKETVPYEFKSAIKTFFDFNLNKTQAIEGIYFWVFLYLTNGYLGTELEELKGHYYTRKSNEYKPITDPVIIQMLEKEELSFGILFEEQYLNDTAEEEDIVVKVSRIYYKIISRYRKDLQANTFKRHFARIRETEVATHLIQFSNGDYQSIEQSLNKIRSKLFGEVDNYLEEHASMEGAEEQLNRAKQMYDYNLELELVRLKRLFANNGIIDLRRKMDIQKITLSYCNSTGVEPAYLLEFIHDFKKSMADKESDDNFEQLYRTYVRNFEHDYVTKMKKILINTAEGMDDGKVSVFGVSFELYYLATAYIKLCPDKNETIRVQIKEWLKDA